MSNDYRKYYGCVFVMNTDIQHHGILGMKWGVRRTPEYLGRRNIRKNKKYTDDVNEIVRSLSTKDKNLLGAPKDQEWIDGIEMVSNISKTAMKKKHGKPVSFVEIWDNGGDVGEVALATRSGEQGKGYADKATKKAMKWAEKTGSKQLKSLEWYVDENNEGSRHLAEKYGFSLDPDTKRGNEVKYTKNLGQKKLFVSGSSKTQDPQSGYYRKKLPREVRKDLKKSMRSNDKILVGDAPGIDRQVQDYLNKKKYKDVEVYGPGKKVRYSANSKWKTNPIDAPEYEEGSKEWLAKKDIAMAKNADKGLAVILDEGAKATRNNVARLQDSNKEVHVYELNKKRYKDAWSKSYKR